MDLPANDTEFRSWSEQISTRLDGCLPGRDAQFLLAPRPRFGAYVHQDPREARPAAVFALLVRIQNQPSVLLTRRSTSVKTHRGQISFPGGAVEAGESALDAALREVHEEIGIERGSIRVLGKLSPLFVAVSGYEVQPFVGALDELGSTAIDGREVAEMLSVPLSRLLDPDTQGEREQVYRGNPVSVPFFKVDRHEVWGATAMMLSELLAVVRSL